MTLADNSKDVAPWLQGCGVFCWATLIALQVVRVGAALSIYLNTNIVTALNEGKNLRTNARERINNKSFDTSVR